MGETKTSSAAERLSKALSEIEGVRLAFLFGSRARDEARKDSDFDIAVLVDDSLAAQDRGKLVRQLVGRLGKGSIEHAPRHRHPERCSPASPAPGPARRKDLVRIAPEERARFATKTIRDYQDGAVRREAFTRRRIERLKAKTYDGGPRDLLEKARGVAKLLGKDK